MKMIMDNTPNEYRGDDGIIYCTVCHEPKQMILDFNNTKTVVRRECACVRAEQKKKDEMARQSAHRKKVTELRKVCFLNDSMAKCTFGASAQDTPATEVCRKYAEHWAEFRKRNIGLMLWGRTGNGKTYMAASIANALLEQEISVQMRSLSYYMDPRSEVRDELLRSVLKPELLILDDFGAERDTSFGLEVVFDVIDERYKSRKPLIITTNVPLHVLDAPDLDNTHRRIYDRIKEMCNPVFFEGGSLRNGVRAQNMEAMRRILSGSADEG